MAATPNTMTKIATTPNAMPSMPDDADAIPGRQLALPVR
jgi:hypothetical protein